MKLTRIKWRAHPILGDLELDFRNQETGIPYQVVLFAGENGTGKTTILETLSSFLVGGTFNFFEFIEYLADGRIILAVPPIQQGSQTFYDMLDGLSRVEMTTSPQHLRIDNLEQDIRNIRLGGCVFSKARADYKTTPIAGTTNMRLDTNKYSTDDEDDFTSSKQLLIDISSQDDNDYAETNRNLGENPQPWREFYPTSKLFRFSNAFDNFFEKMKFGSVADDNAGGGKSIFFKKNEKRIPIDQLSTGEKQIVFRGCYLLKNSKNLGDATIMIDEPELSMHPKWQKKVFKYYTDLFSENGVLKSQLLLASHSEHVLSEALNDKNQNLVIVLNDDNGVIRAKRIDTPGVLPSITSAETNYLAFDIVSNDYHIELYGWLQDKEGKNKITDCDGFIKQHALYDAAIHRKTSRNGNTTYETLSTFIRNAIHHPDNGNTFSEYELRISTELLIKLCQ